MSMPRLYNITLYLSLIGLILSIASVADSGQHKNIFKWLFLYMPTLWVFWLGCVFFIRLERRLSKLFLLWVIIDSAILALLISFAGTGDSWAKARDADMILLLVYFPVIIPTGFLLNFVPKIANPTLDSLVKIFGGDGVGDAVGIWLCMSGFAAVQSFWMVGLFRFLMRKKWGKNQPKP